jgi:hypothetical protein
MFRGSRTVLSAVASRFNFAEANVTRRGFGPERWAPILGQSLVDRRETGRPVFLFGVTGHA